jgi:tetratricopeptide (TPR) repeat protein
MSTESSSKPDLFKNGVLVLLTLISLFVAGVTFLQSYAGLQAEDLVQQSEFIAVNSTGLSFRAGLDVAQGVDAQQRYADYVQRAIRADTKARALRLGGWTDLAANFDLDAERWNRAAAESRLADPLLFEYGQDVELYQQTLQRQAHFEEEKQHILLDQSRAWGGKANSYVAVLSTLSVALFLVGLSLTLSSRVKYLLVAAGVILTAACALWTFVILFLPIPAIPDEAVEHFVEGQIRLALDDDDNPAEAIEEFDAAIELAPDYGRAYFFRSFANTDSALSEQHLDTGRAVADMLKAIELGDDSADAYGNLGWLYYLNGQYNSALEMTRKALELTQDQCYLPFNHGLILLVMGSAQESETAYGDAIACALQQSDYWRGYWLDVGVIDLSDLREARPDLEGAVEPKIVRLKNAIASIEMYDTPEPAQTSATFGELVFGAALDEDDNVTDLAQVFPQTTTRVYAQFDYEGMSPEDLWLTRWLRDGQEELSTLYPEWEYDETGSVWVSFYNNAGLNPGEYELNVFVNGNLMASGRFTIQPGDLPDMNEHYSYDVGVTINYPRAYKVVELADNEVSMVAARDPENPPFFFGVVAYQASTGTDEDIFGLFDFFSGAMTPRFEDFEMEPEESFTVADKEGWIRYYTYSDLEGRPIQGAVVGVLNSALDTVYLLDAETLSDQWEPNLDMFNVMLSRITIEE